MMTPVALQVKTDTRPWGGISPISVLNARVDSVSTKFGAAFDSAKLIFPADEFSSSSFLIAHTPIRITDANNVVIFRGFIPKSENYLRPGNEGLTVTCLDYKWLLAKRTLIRGRWYTTKGATVPPAGWGMGSGLSAGDAKYKYEKWRSDLHEGSGFLHNVPTVFNRGGVPDCLIDNQITNNNVLFYYNDVNQAEDDVWTASRFESYDNDGYYWSWATILRYIFVHWIAPYNASLAPVKFLDSDLTKIRDNIDDTLLNPIDFSIQGNNPLEAIDNVVKAIPGRWTWWMEYQTAKVLIRFKQLKDFAPAAGSITLTAIDKDGTKAARKLCHSAANVNTAQVTRDSTHGVANVLALGGKMKLVTTVKLMPMWRRFAHPTISGDLVDFADAAELALWQRWVLKDEKSDRHGQDKAEEVNISAEQEKRFPTIYRDYAVPIEGRLFGHQIVSEDPDDEEDVVTLDGDIGNEYDDHTDPDPSESVAATMRHYFFQDAQITRSMSPPEFERYSDKAVVFLYDDLYTYVPADGEGNAVNLAPKKGDAAAIAAAKKAMLESRKRWVFPETDGVAYSLDSKNMIVRFRKPQFMRRTALAQMQSDALKNTVNSLSRVAAPKKTRAITRDVYITATFTTDMPAVLSSKVSLGYFEGISGAPFTEYIKLPNQEIVVHENAWYPLDWINRDTTTPVDSTALMDGHKVGVGIRKCDAFDNYRKYIGEGHIELARALIAWKGAHQTEHMNVSATLPYYEAGNALGGTLSAIHGSGYEEGDGDRRLSVYLAGINWARIGESDYMTTQYNFTNVYGSNKRSSLDFASRAPYRNKKFSVQRIAPQVFNNEKADGGDLPSI